MKCQQKPIIVEAFQWNGEQKPTSDWPEWFASMWDNRKVQWMTELAESSKPVLFIKHNFNTYMCCVGDYVVRHSANLLSICPQEFFLAVYEVVGE